MKGIQATRPYGRNRVAEGVNKAVETAQTPPDEQLRIRYGVITEVNNKTMMVRIQLEQRSGKKVMFGATDKNKDGIFVPIVQPLHVIHLLFGALRKGLIVRVFSRGKQGDGTESIAEVISDREFVEFTSGQQTVESNELATGPHDIFTGGVNYK